MHPVHSFPVQDVRVTIARDVRVNDKPRRWHVDIADGTAVVKLGRTIEELTTNAFEAGRTFGQIEGAADVRSTMADADDGTNNIEPISGPQAACPLLPSEDAGSLFPPRRAVRGTQPPP